MLFGEGKAGLSWCRQTGSEGLGLAREKVVITFIYCLLATKPQKTYMKNRCSVVNPIGF